MKSKIFTGEQANSKRFLKTAPYRASEAASLIIYKDCFFKEEAQSAKPNQNKIKTKDLFQKNTLTGLAKVYSERILKSQVSFNLN